MIGIGKVTEIKGVPKVAPVLLDKGVDLVVLDTNGGIDPVQPAFFKDIVA